MEYPFVIGTAGHIDHGKTSLVKAMTGIDCDRLDEEKRRGITIELGFAPLNLASRKTVSIVDVPGHERFIRQMAAGASGIDVALLIVAANEGVMPQTREHLDILNLLGVRSGLVVLTKKDLVDDETLEIAKSEVSELIQGTCLSTAAIIPVSSLSGEGVPEILVEIEKILDKIPPRKGFGAFFLPIDRVFGKKGFGVVVTGTAYQGAVAEGDEVQVMPSLSLARVRSLQAHGIKVDSVQAGQRVAVNLSAVSREDMERGNAVCAKGTFIPTDCINAWLDVLPSAREGVKHRQRVRLHVGTVDVVARISLLKPNAGTDEKNVYAPGSGGPIRIFTESKITVAAGQRFVIRFYSPLVTIGGGRILLPNASLSKNRKERLQSAEILSVFAENFGPISFLAALIQDRGILSVSGLFELSQMDKTVFNEFVDKIFPSPDSCKYMEFGKSRIFISGLVFDKIAKAVQGMLKEFHAEYPELAGLGVEKLYSSLNRVHGTGIISPVDFKDLMIIMVEKKIISAVVVRDITLYRSVDFNQPLDTKLIELAGRMEGLIESAGFNLLTLSDLEEKLASNPSNIKRAAAYLKEQEDLRTIEGGLLFSRQMREKLLSVLSSMDSMEEEISVSSLRYKLGLSRKYTLPMLDFTDSQGLTKRIGDKRILVHNP